MGGGRLYDTWEGTQANLVGIPIVEERDGTTGARIGSAQLPNAVIPPTLEPATKGAGVWASYRSGMAGTSQLLNPEGLVIQPAPRGSRQPWLKKVNIGTDV